MCRDIHVKYNVIYLQAFKLRADSSSVSIALWAATKSATYFKISQTVAAHDFYITSWRRFFYKYCCNWCNCVCVFFLHWQLVFALRCSPCALEYCAITDWSEMNTWRDDHWSRQITEWARWYLYRFCVRAHSDIVSCGWNSTDNEWARWAKQWAHWTSTFLTMASWCHVWTTAMNLESTLPTQPSGIIICSQNSHALPEGLKISNVYGCMMWLLCN